MSFASHMPFPSGKGVQFVPPSFKQEIPEISVGPYTGKPWEGFGPIGPYNPDTDESKVVPLDFLGGFMQDRNLAGSYGQPSNMPDYMYESIQRQYGNPKFGNYSIEDKKNVINWYNRMKV